MARISKRKDGRYLCRYKGKCFYGSTQGEAARKRDEHKRLIEDGMQAALLGITVEEYVKDWLPVHKASVSKKVYNDYACHLERLMDVIGSLYMHKVKPSDIKRVFSEYIGMSASTIHRARMLFISVFDSAQQDGYIRVNPCRSEASKPHKGEAGTHRNITE